MSTAMFSRVRQPAPPPPAPFQPLPALVVFVGETSLPWLRWLRPGFRHCFVAVACGETWILCDPLSHRTELAAVSGLSGEELADWYRRLGLIVVATTTRPAPPRLAPVRPYSCVEAVKRVLGLHAPQVFTPWQLFRLLTETTAGGGLTNLVSRNIYL